jgi:hypothetical protein
LWFQRLGCAGKRTRRWSGNRTLRRKCGLTPRSTTGPTTAGRRAGKAGIGILAFAGPAPCRSGPVSSNVRPHNTPMSDQLTSLALVVQHCQAFARERLRSAGQVAPFGVYVQPHRTKLNLLGATATSSAESYELLEARVEELAKKGVVSAYALTASVALPEAFNSKHIDGIRVHVEAPNFSRFIYTPYRVLPYRALRHFLLVLPCVDYGDEVLVDTAPKAYAASAA